MSRLSWRESSSRELNGGSAVALIFGLTLLPVTYSYPAE